MAQAVSWVGNRKPLIIGHRGFPSVARENTVESFRHALDAGADGVEFDVWVTGDGIPVVHHDPLAPTETADVDLRTATWAEVSQARFRSSYGIYVVSRLSEVLAAVGGALLNVEIKAPAPDRQTATVSGVLAALESVTPRETILISSFDEGILGELDGCGYSLAYLYREADGSSNRPHGMSAIHPRHDLITPELLTDAASSGLAVNAWTVNDPDRAAGLVEMGVGGIITDHPDRVVREVRG